MDLWAIDIGTSCTHVCLFLDGWQLIAEPNDRIDSLNQALSHMRRAHGSPDLPVAVSAVNAPQYSRLGPLLERTLGCRSLRVGKELPVPIALDVDTPADIGTDRLCDAVAAVKLCGAPAIIADLGSAVTVDAVDATGRFVGGTILPGLTTQAEALHRMAAHLPTAAIDSDSTPPGKNTHDAISAGIRYGMAGAIREIVARLRAVVGESAPLVVTGGHAACVLDFISDPSSRHEPNLCCLGVKAVYEAHAASRAGQ